jgi:predicted transcriptional regulator YdeE
MLHQNCQQENIWETVLDPHGPEDQDSDMEIYDEEVTNKCHFEH